MLTTTFDQLILIFSKLMSHSLIWDHSIRVAELSYRVGKELFNSKDAKILYQAGHLHDIGWIYNLKNESFLTPNLSHPDDGYFLLLKFTPEHKIAELIRHHHCYPKNYVSSYNELNRGYPIETCEQLAIFDNVLQTLQICNEYDFLSNYTEKDPITELIFLATIDRWDLDLTRRIVSIL